MDALLWDLAAVIPPLVGFLAGVCVGLAWALERQDALYRKLRARMKAVEAAAGGSPEEGLDRLLRLVEDRESPGD